MDARSLADELTSVRGRGLNEIDHVKGRAGAAGRQVRLELPGLERLAAEHGLDRGSRTLDLRLLLRRGLDAFGEEFPGDAATIRSLYFDPDGEPPPPQGASALLRQARGEMSESSFRRRQRGLLERLAAFLLTWESAAPTPTEPVPPPPPTAAPTPVAPPAVTARRRWRATAAGVGLAAAAALVAVVLTLALVDGAGPADSESGVAGEPAVADYREGPSVPVRFNSLGGTTSKVIDVFDDPRADRDEAVKTGTYLHDQTNRAYCVTTGRSVVSAVAQGEEDRSSDRWLLIDGPPGVDSYATLTYLDVRAIDLARLPECPAVTASE